MKTPSQKFKSKINKIIIRLTNQGNHTAASQLYQTYFFIKIIMIKFKDIMQGQYLYMNYSKITIYNVLKKKKKPNTKLHLFVR